MRKEQMPFGMLYKKVKDNKYENVLNLRHELVDSLFFCDALQKEAEQRELPASSYEIPFTVLNDSAGVFGISFSKGSYRTFQHLIEDTPSVVAKQGFISNTIDMLLDATERLHKQDIYHLCFAPSNVLARRSDNQPMLLFHGSNYHRLGNYKMLYPECEEYLAPELFEDGEPTAAADIYSLGKFIEFICRESGKTPELAYLVKKATSADPSKRYQSIADMRRQLKLLRTVRRIGMWVVAALAIALLGWMFWSTMQPPKEDIEYVPVQKEEQTDILSPTTSEEEEYGLFEGYTPDSTKISPEEYEKRQTEQKELDAKAEEIFRKYFTRDAERILSALYSSENMATSEDKYITSSQQAMNELVRAQTEIAERAGLSDTRAQLLASQIIDQITTRKKTQQAIRQQTNLMNTRPTGESTSSGTTTTPSTGSSSRLGGTGGATSGSAGTTSGTSTSTRPDGSAILRHDLKPSEQRGQNARERTRTLDDRRVLDKK